VPEESEPAAREGRAARAERAPREHSAARTQRAKPAIRAKPPIRARLRRAARDGRRRVRLEAVIAAQAGIAAGVAWFLAADVLRHNRPFFAPISAVIVLGGASGQRWRRALELVLGVALGIGLGDLLVLLIGVGVLQITLVVALAIVIASFLGGGTLTVNQAAASAVLVATLAPSGGIYSGRIVDALIGGLTGLAVMALVVPFNPLTRVRRSADGELQVLSRALTMAREALDVGDPTHAVDALQRLRAIEGEHQRLRGSLEAGRETATLAPLRWRSRPVLARYLEAEVHVERAIRNARVLMRRTVSLLRNAEPVPAGLAQGLSGLAGAVDSLRRELADGVEAVRARQLLTAAVSAASSAYRDGLGFSGGVVVAQIRSAALDLLRATGLPEDRAEQLVRQAGPLHPGRADEDG
jgi:uncharacterized membrane protein YgaE (UPF0421/DUF939 family)